MRTFVFVLAGVAFSPGAASAVQHQVDILLDLDDDATTGCTVTTVDGPFDGVEQILVTTVETASPPPAGTVTDVAIRDCTNPATDTFGPPASFDGGWPIGVDNGVGGRDVVETYFPLVSSVVASPTTVHLAVVVTDEFGGEQALLTTDDTPDGGPILLVVQALGVPDIPTLGEWGLILLALALATASFFLLGRRGTVAFGVAVLLLATGTAWAAGGLDGLTGDWSASDQLASNGIVLFGKAAGDDLCFRVDVDLLFNTSPTADPQAVSTDEETPVAIVLTGSDPESDPLTFSIVSGPANGSLSGAPPNVTYTPDADYNGPDSFDFQVEDTSGATDTATVSITVDPVNDPPVAQDDAFTTDEDTQLVGDVLADNGSGADSDLDGDTLSVNTTPVSVPTDGTLVLDADGTFTYDPDPDFNGVDSFEYEISDGNGGTDVGLVTITVASVNDPPVAQDDAFSTDEDVQLSGGNVLADNGSGADSDGEGDPLTVNTTPVSAPANGTLVLNADGTFTYDPNPDFNGADSFEYQVSDGNGGTDVGLVSITINPINDDPTAVDDNFLVSEDSLNNALDVLANDDDAPDTGETLTITGVGAPDQGGSVAVNGTNDGLVYSPAPNFVGNETFTYDIADGNGGTATATVTVAVAAVNDAPVVDLDADDSGGTVGTGYAVAYAENDGAVAAVDATDATITDVDSADLDSVIITLQNLLDAGEELLTATSGDPDITVESYDTTTVPGEGILRLTTTSPQPIADFVTVLRTVTYEHTGDDPDTSNPRTIAFVADDGIDTGPAAISTVTITAANDPPVAQDDAYTTPEDTQLVAGSVLDDNGSGPDTDPEGDSLTVNTTPVSGPSDGTLTLAADGTFTYDPDPDFEGVDTFEYEVSDGNGGTDTATVSITVTAVNDPPVAQDDAFTTDEDVQLAGNVLVDNGSGIDDDADGDTLTVNTTPVTAPTDGTLVLNADGSFTYDPDPNFNGSDSFTYEVSDGNGGTDTAVVSITVTAVDDPPVAVADAAMVNEDSGANAIPVLANDTDIDGGPKTIQSKTDPPNGTVAITGGGTGLTYTPNLNYCNDGSPTDDFTYTLNGGSSTTVSVTVICINDPPVAGNDTFDFTGNTELRVDLAASATPHALETTGSGLGLLDNDSDPVENDPISIVSITGCADGTAPFDCTIAGVGTVHVESNGTFSFVPLPGDTDPSEVFQYTLSDGTDTVNGTVTLNRTERVWYVQNDTPTAGTAGTSVDPFDTLVEAQTASLANDYIFVYFGNGTSTGQNAGISLKSGQHLLGEHVGLSIPVSLNGNGSPTVLFAAVPGNRPVLDDAAAGGPEGVSAVDVIPAEVAGLSLSGNVNAIEWTTTAGFAGGGTLFEIRDNVVTGAGAIGVDVNLGGTGATRLSFHDNAITANGTALNVQETGAGALTITAFDDNSVNGATGGSGMILSNAIFDAVPGGAFDLVSGGTTAIGSPGNGVGGAGLTMGGVSGDLLFTDLDVFADAGAAISVGGTGASNLAGGTGLRFRVGAGVGMAVATGGPAVSLTNLTADLQLSSLTSTGSTTTGVSLTGVTDGGGTNAVFTAGAGSAITLAGGTSAAFLVSGGNARIAYGGTIVNNASGANAVSISTWAGDDASDDLVLSGSIDENGAGIRVQNNAGSRAITFSGGLDIDTTGSTSEGFVATSNTNTLGVNVTGSANDIDSVSATALRVTNTTIGSSHLNFRRVASGNGNAQPDPANGIVLNTTGSTGRLIVSGTGGAGTGGTIRNTTGDGILLTSTRGPSFTSMSVLNTAGHGVKGTQVTDFTFANGTIDNSGTGLGAETANIAFNTTAAGTENNLSGVVTITGNTLTNAYYHGVDIFNFSGTISDATISNNTITSSVTTANSKGSGIRFIAFGSAGTVANITRATIANNVVSNFPSAAGIQVQGGNGNAAGPSGTVGTPGSVSDVVAITGNRIAGANAENKMGTQAILAVVNGKGQGNFEIIGNGTVANPIAQITGTAIAVSSLGNSTVTANVSNNVIAANNGLGSNGIGAGTSRTFLATDTPSLTVTILNNAISQTDGNGILVTARDATGTVRAKIQNNSVAAPLSGNRNGIRVDAGNGSSADDSVCLNISGNTSAGVGLTPEGIGLRKQGAIAATNDFALHGFATSPATAAQTAAYVTGQNPGSASGTLIINGDNFNSPTCSFP